ncbi:MAG: hypothetical protein HY788_07460 [Deltaproteobacteria bacterium]|nr:hypothetical protein [Deltaproteobacteria bacterium]
MTNSHSSKRCAGATAVALVVFFALFAAPFHAAAWLPEQADVSRRTDTRFMRLPLSLENDLTYLLSLTSLDNDSLDLSEIQDLLRFVASGRGNGAYFQPNDRAGSEGTFCQTDLNVSLNKIIAYNYSPDIPSYVAHPGSVRLSGWKPKNGLWKDLRKLSRPLPDEDSYVVVRGVEYQEITPDTNSGGYYRYDSRRVLIRGNDKSHPFVISISRQIEPSGPGRKGVIIGDADEWNYFYSGREGLTVNGLGWASTYIYDSFFIAVYYQPDTKSPVTRHAVFSWLKGGWCSVNVVSADHIYEGTERAMTTFKEVMESPRLPDPGIFADLVKQIRSYTDPELRNRLIPHLFELQKLSKNHPVLSRNDFSGIIREGKYLERMSREELESMAVLEYFKRELGKKSHITETALSSNTPSGQNPSRIRR